MVENKIEIGDWIFNKEKDLALRDYFFEYTDKKDVTIWGWTTFENTYRAFVDCKTQARDYLDVGIIFEDADFVNVIYSEGCQLECCGHSVYRGVFDKERILTAINDLISFYEK